MVGARGRELYKTLTVVLEASPRSTQDSPAAKVTLKGVLDAFEKHCNPPKNETVDRYQFFTRQQVGGESIEHYITELKLLAANCNFMDLRDSLIRDKIISGILDDGLRARLLRESDLTLEKGIQNCRASEVTKERMTVFRAQSVHAVRKCRPKIKEQTQKTVRLCKFGGNAHVFDKDKCPAYGKT